MDLADYQRSAARTINPSLDAQARLVDAAAGLAEEAGEVLGIVRKHVYMAHELDRERLKKELGDVLWCLAVVSGTVGLTLDEVAEANVAKLRARYPDGYSEEASKTGRDPRPASDP